MLFAYKRHCAPFHAESSSKVWEETNVIHSSNGLPRVGGGLSLDSYTKWTVQFDFSFRIILEVCRITIALLIGQVLTIAVTNFHIDLHLSQHAKKLVLNKLTAAIRDVRFPSYVISGDFSLDIHEGGFK